MKPGGDRASGIANLPFLNHTHMAKNAPSKIQQILIRQMLDPVKNEMQEMFGIDDLMKRIREKNYVKARTFFYRYATTRYKLTREKLGWYSNRDHASVSYALKSFSDITSYDKLFATEYTSIADRLDTMLNNDPDEKVRDFLVDYIRMCPLSRVEEIFVLMNQIFPGITEDSKTQKELELNTETA